MKSNLQLLIVSIVAISIPTIALTLLTGLFWIIFNLSLTQSFVAALLFSGISCLVIFKRLQYEIKEFNINLEDEDGEFL